MVYDADELPREGHSSQPLIDRLSERVGSNNSLDFIMRNMPQIARAVGARPPAMLPQDVAVAPQRMPPTPRPAVPDTPPIPPKPGDLPDTPRGLHTPPAKMMPGSDTKPGEPLSKEDVESFRRVVAESSARRLSAGALPHANFNYPPRQFAPPQTAVKPTYFKDGLGNEYKTVGDSLYVLGWQDATVKIRMLNVDTGKEIPSKGRKFQIYGWHLVQKSEEPDATTAPDVTSMEDEMRLVRPDDSASIRNPTAAKAVENRTRTDEKPQTEPVSTPSEDTSAECARTSHNADEEVKDGVAASTDTEVVSSTNPTPTAEVGRKRRLI